MDDQHKTQLQAFSDKVDACMKDLKDHVLLESDKIDSVEDRFDKHLEIYANNGKELAAVKANQAWLMKFFWVFMTPIASGIVYLVIHVK